MIKKVLEDKNLSAAWLAKRLNNSRTNGHKIIHEKKFNDIMFLIEVSIATGHNFLQDLAQITDDEIEYAKNQKQ